MREIAEMKEGRVELKPEDIDVDDYGNDTDMDDNDDEIVAIGAPFLAQESSGESVSSAFSDSSEFPSKVVALPIGQANAERIEAWQNELEMRNGYFGHGQNSSYAPTPADSSAQLQSFPGQYDNGPVDSSYVHTPADGSAQLQSFPGQYHNGPVDSSMMILGNDNGMLPNHGGFNNLNFGNNSGAGLSMDNLGFANSEAAVKRGDGAQFDDSNVAEYGALRGPYGSGFNGTGDQGGGFSGNGGYQYSSALPTGGNLPHTINPLALHMPSNGGHNFSNGFGGYGPLIQGMGYTESSFASPNMTFNGSTGGYRSGVTASTPKHKSNGNDKISKGGVRNASNGGFGAASSFQAGRRNEMSEQQGIKQEKSAEQAGQSHTGNNSLVGMPSTPFNPTLPVNDDLSGGVGFNDSNQNDVPEWLQASDFSWTKFLNDDDHDPFGGIH